MTTTQRSLVQTNVFIFLHIDRLKQQTYLRQSPIHALLDMISRCRMQIKGNRRITAVKAESSGSTRTDARSPHPTDTVLPSGSSDPVCSVPSPSYPTSSSISLRALRSRSPSSVKYDLSGSPVKQSDAHFSSSCAPAGSASVGYWKRPSPGYALLPNDGQKYLNSRISI